MATDGFSAVHAHDIEFLIHGRRSRTRRLTWGETKSQLRRTVNRAPEVIVRVSGGGKTVRHVKDHMDYITRNGKLDAVDERGNRIRGKREVGDLHDSWDLDICNGQGKFRQAFNVILSMPAGTDPHKLFKAAQNLAREQLAGRHQYAMVLHTPETDPHKNPPKHPHVHLVIKAEDVDGKRLYIRKATLEIWRTAFAEKLREQGIEANATHRDIRGKTQKNKSAGEYRTTQRGTSTALQHRFEQVRRDVSQPKPWEVAILARRRAVLHALQDAATTLRQEGDDVLATAVEQYAKELPRPETERHKMQRAIAGRMEQRKHQQQEGPVNRDDGIPER